MTLITYKPLYRDGNGEMRYELTIIRTLPDGTPDISYMPFWETGEAPLVEAIKAYAEEVLDISDTVVEEAE